MSADSQPLLAVATALAVTNWCAACRRGRKSAIGATLAEATILATKPDCDIAGAPRSASAVATLSD
jgi:hypothetical protein